MRRSEKEIKDRRVIDEILREATTVYLGLVDGQEAYVVPMNFGYDGAALWLHSAADGRKMQIMARNPRVSFTVVESQKVVPAAQACHWSSAYRSVMGTGRAVLVKDRAQKEKGLDLVLGKYATGPFEYDHSILERTVVLKVEIESLTGKRAGQP